LSDPGFAVVATHFYPEVTARLRHQYRTFRTQFLRPGVPLITMAVGAHYQPWVDEFPEVRLVEGDLLFQQARLWMEGARIAAAEGLSRFVCLDADVVFSDPDWIPRVHEAFGRGDVIQPFETGLHLYEDARMKRRTIVQWSKGRGGHNAAGLGVGFDTRFLEAFGLYEYAIVGGGDKVFWDAVRHVLPVSTESARHDKVGTVLRDAGFPQNAAVDDSVRRWIERGRRSYESPRLAFAEGVHVVAMPFGHKGNREYRSRYQLLGTFDPDRDLTAKPGQGLSFASGAEQLKADVERYLRSRAA